jgi:antitoxin component of RelBE/YafQ-DinJ toxin-antitoxin module
MRAQVHDMPVRFRVNEALLSKAMQKAEREGMSLSELMRSALRRELHRGAVQ